MCFCISLNKQKIVLSTTDWTKLICIWKNCVCVNYYELCWEGDGSKWGVVGGGKARETVWKPPWQMAVLGGSALEAVLTSSPSSLLHHCWSSMQLQMKPWRTSLNKTSAAKKSKFCMEKSFEPLVWIFRATGFTGQNGTLGLNIPQRVQRGVLYSLHLNANDNKTTWQYTLESWFKTAPREGKGTKKRDFILIFYRG